MPKTGIAPAPNHAVTQPNLYKTDSDAEQVVVIRSTVPRELIKELSVVDPKRVTFAIAWTWVQIGLAIWLAVSFPNPFVILPVIIFVGLRQHALGVLMHEGVHWRMYKSRVVNEWVSDVFCAWPIISSTEYYRSGRHIPHHRNLGLVDDPHRWQSMHTKEIFPLSKGQVAKMAIKEVLFGPVSLVVITLMSLRYYPSRASLVARMAFYAAAIGLLVKYGLVGQFLLLYLVPFVTVFRVCILVRTLIEHYGIPGSEGDAHGTKTRTTISTWLGRSLFLPFGINYHYEHHLYPGVPGFNLAKVHALVQRQVAEGAMQPYHVSKGVMAALGELTGAKRETRAPRSL